MARCRGKTLSDNRCHNTAQTNTRFCYHHQNQIDYDKISTVGLSTIAGLAISATPAGAVIGAAVGYLIDKDKKMKTKVFVSFDFDNDRKLKDFIIGQARNSDSPFEIIDHSLKEAAPERSWEQKAHTAIARSDIVIVMVGPQTHRAQGVLKEVNMARNLNKRIVQVIGYKDGNYTAVPSAGRLYKWNWDNLKKLLG